MRPQPPPGQFLGIQKHEKKAVKYTLTCTAAHCDLDLYPVQLEASPIIHDEIMMIKSLLDGQDQHEHSHRTVLCHQTSPDVPMSLGYSVRQPS